MSAAMRRIRVRAARRCCAASLRLAMGASLLCGATSFSAALTAPVAARTSRLLSHPRSQRATILARRAVGDGDMVQKGTADRSHVVIFKEQEVTAKHGETLRTALLRSGVTPHNGQAQLINCRGLGTCGTCAVEIEGDVSPKSWNAKEGLRLNFPPHKSPGNQKLRLACQVSVEGDLKLTKYDGFWGQGDAKTADTSFSIPFGELEYVLDSNKK